MFSDVELILDVTLIASVVEIISNLVRISVVLFKLMVELSVAFVKAFGEYETDVEAFVVGDDNSIFSDSCSVLELKLIVLLFKVVEA